MGGDYRNVTSQVSGSQLKLTTLTFRLVAHDWVDRIPSLVGFVRHQNKRATL